MLFLNIVEIQTITHHVHFEDVSQQPNGQPALTTAPEKLYINYLLEDVTVWPHGDRLSNLYLSKYINTTPTTNEGNQRRFCRTLGWFHDIYFYQQACSQLQK